MGFPDLETAKVTFFWSGSRAEYHFQVANDRDFSHLVVDERELNADFAGISGLAAGTYYWRVAGIDSAGAKGEFSTTQKFSLVEEAADRSHGN